MDIGTWGEWFGAAATVGAVYVALRGIRRERKAWENEQRIREQENKVREEEKRDTQAAQARLIFQDPTIAQPRSQDGSTLLPYWVVHRTKVTNESDKPIRNLRISVLQDGKELAAKTQRTLALRAKDELVVEKWKPEEPQLRQQPVEEDSSSGIRLEFVDVAGLRWSVVNNGKPQRVIG